MSIGERIKQIRVFKMNWSHDDLANHMGFRNKETVLNWERDLAYPSLNNFVKLLKVFNVSFDEFMKGVELW